MPFPNYRRSCQFPFVHFYNSISITVDGCGNLGLSPGTEVEATNTNRSFTMYYANTTFGEDVKRDVSSIYYFQEFSISSDEVPQEYHLSVECLEDRVSNSNQFITTRIYEDGILQVERFSGGTSDIIEDRTYISAFLPTGIKVEEY